MTKPSRRLYAHLCSPEIRSFILSKARDQPRGLRYAHQSTKFAPTSRSRIPLLCGALVLAPAIWYFANRNERRIIACDSSAPERSVQLAKEKPKIPLAVFKSHNTKDSLWVAVDGEVWDVTGFLEQHPGGPDALLANSGKDASNVYHSIHPPGTLQETLDPACNKGRLDEAAMTVLQAVKDEELQRISAARRKLPSVNSIVSIDDFEHYAKDVCSETAWEYYSHGAETESALRNNLSAFDRVFFRPRVLRNVWDTELGSDILGFRSDLPLYVAPTAQNGLAQELGEIAVTRGAGSQRILQVLSHVASQPLTAVCAERVPGQAVAWQLYMHPDREKARKEIEEAVKLGVHSIWLTVDTAVLGKRTGARVGMAKRSPRPYDEPLNREPTTVLSGRYDTGLNWSDIRWIKSIAPDTPLVLKGIGAWEDAERARQEGADAICLSNHGGRELDYANAPLKTLYDIRQNSPETIRDKNFQIYLDGGIRRGTDVLKALCLGADAVGLGRPFIYAAAGWKSDGVEKAIMILREELEISMRLLGVTKLDQLGPEYLDCSRL